MGDPGRDTWGLEHGGNKLRVNEPQDGVEGPNPPEVDVTEVVAQFLYQPQALLIPLHLGMGGGEASDATTAHCTPYPPHPSHPLNSFCLDYWSTLVSTLLSQLLSVDLCLFLCLPICLSLFFSVSLGDR